MDILILLLLSLVLINLFHKDLDYSSIVLLALSPLYYLVLNLTPGVEWVILLFVITVCAFWWMSPSENER